jgi:26S proteasome regulatory subunit N2
LDTQDADPILRHGGMYAVALAYRGTANNAAIRRLLHFAVSDVSDDVRRAAVLSLGLVLYQTPEQVCHPPSPAALHPCLAAVG